MAEVKYPVLSYLIVSDSVAQSPDGKLTLYGIFSKIFAHTLPATHPVLCLSMCWGFGSPGKYKTKMVLIGPSGKELFNTNEIEFELKTEDSIANFIFTIQGLEIKEAGRYWGNVYLNGEQQEQKTLFTVEIKAK